jgi:hypothetical protein
MYATRATLHSALQTTPGALAFGRDMVLDIPVIADLQLIQERRQQLINDRLIIANRKIFSYDYAVGHYSICPSPVFCPGRGFESNRNPLNPIPCRRNHTTRY